MSETILVTGGAGFIGFHTSKKLLELGKNIIIIDNFNDYYNVKLKEDRIAQLPKKDLKVYNEDIADFKAISRIIKKNPITKICHLAAQAGVRYSLKNPFIYERSNVLGTLNLLEAAKQSEIKDFVLASSSSVYGNNKKIPFSEEDNVDNPISFYAATKKSAELIAHTYSHLYNINCTALRFFTVYGPWGRPDMSYYKFTQAITEGKKIPVYNYGKMKRDFTFIEDAVPAIITALERPFKYEIFNIGNSKPIELNYFIEVLENTLGKTAEKELMEDQQGDVKQTFADISKAKKMLNYKPKTSISEGLKEFVEWYKKYKVNSNKYK
ncbi:GDP-mannose 4,6-dehydratase [Candidatus Woesearchaeota archaeon]|nr:GDP-mannose 4,6-dehydratase [Candidatus Woesearchaeota archaeon]